jgi:hypothetical protein
VFVEQPQLIRQAFRFALDVRPEQEALLLSFTGATRFFFNWGLALVKQRLEASPCHRRARSLEALDPFVA